MSSRRSIAPLDVGKYNSNLNEHDSSDDEDVPQAFNYKDANRVGGKRDEGGRGEG